MNWRPRFHLSTAMACMLAASILLGANVYERRPPASDVEAIAQNSDESFGHCCFVQGWPIAFRWTIRPSDDGDRFALAVNQWGESSFEEMVRFHHPDSTKSYRR